MFNRLIVGICIAAFVILIGLNVMPLFWSASPSTYIRQDNVNDMAIVHQGLPYTLNFDQQKRVIEILNRAIPVGDIKPTPNDPPVDFDEIIIYTFKKKPIRLKPIAWVEKNLLFQAPDWSESNLLEVSKDQLYKILSNSYDTLPYVNRDTDQKPASH